MTETDDDLLRAFLTGAPDPAGEHSARAATSTDASLLVAAAVVSGSREALARAAAFASTTRERHAVVLGRAHLDGDHERFDALVRDHLADHPDHVLAAWIAAVHAAASRPPAT